MVSLGEKRVLQMDLVDLFSIQQFFFTHYQDVLVESFIHIGKTQFPTKFITSIIAHVSLSHILQGKDRILHLCIISQKTLFVP